jgi:cell division protein FtsN
VAPPPPPPADAPRSAAAGDDRPDALDGLIAKADKTKAPAKPAATDAGAASVVQIGAFSSEQLADKEWSKAAAVAPGAMAGKGKRVVPVTRDGDTLYRTSITGFASREQAAALCNQLKAAGGSCFVH